MILINLIKYVLLFIIFLNSRTLNNNTKTDIDKNFIKFGQYSLTSLFKDIKNIPEINFGVTNLNLTFSKEYNIIEIVN